MVNTIHDYVEYYKYGYDDNVPIISAEDRGEVPATDKEVEEVIAKASTKADLLYISGIINGNIPLSILCLLP